jgi:predicted DNA-binding transcriptional regulator AlpA
MREKMEIIFNGDKYISIDEVLTILEIKEYKLYELMDKNEISKPLKPTPRAFWKKSEIDKFIEKNRK